MTRLIQGSSLLSVKDFLHKLSLMKDKAAAGDARGRGENRPDAARPTSTPLGAAEAFVARIRRLSPKLSRGQRKVADFVIDRCDRAVFLTSAQVAAETSVSEATVVRTARALGFKGYPEFRAALRDFFMERMSTVTRVRLTAGRRRTDADIIEAVQAMDRSNLETTIRRIEPKSYSRAAELICRARHVYIIGLRASHSLAWLLHYSLTLILGNSRLVTLGLADIPEQLGDVGERDVVIGITFERYTKATVELFRRCLAQGAHAIALTDKATSPLAEAADAVLEAQARLGSFIDSYVAATSVINVLVTLIAAKRRRKALRVLARREEMWRRYGTYV